MVILRGVDGFQFGCDPEAFITDPEKNVVSAYGIIPGTKAEPHKVENGAVQVDGLAAEFNIDPVNSFEGWNGNIVSVVRQLKAMLPKGYGLLVVPSVRFSQSVMDAQPDEAKVLGCDPDYNAWTGEVNPTPDVSNEPLLRTAAGHVHVGWTEGMPVTDELHGNHCRDLVKQFDWFLGAPSIRKDPDVTRRQLYGKAGSFRPKSYGMEYRVLSNWWIKNKESRLWVWNRMQGAVNFMAKREYSKVFGSYNETLVDAINTGSVAYRAALEEDFYRPMVVL